jgi:branched-chain amino acid transport system substrate-binding protein
MARLLFLCSKSTHLLQQIKVQAEFVRKFHEKAQACLGLPYPLVNVRASSYSAWQVLEATIVATKSFDDATIAKWIKANKVII